PVDQDRYHPNSKRNSEKQAKSVRGKSVDADSRYDKRSDDRKHHGNGRRAERVIGNDPIKERPYGVRTGRQRLRGGVPTRHNAKGCKQEQIEERHEEQDRQPYRQPGGLEPACCQPNADKRKRERDEKKGYEKSAIAGAGYRRDGGTKVAKDRPR